MDEKDVRQLLSMSIKAVGNQYQWATKFKLSPAYVCDVLKGRRAPGPALCTALGIRRIIRYEVGS